MGNIVFGTGHPIIDVYNGVSWIKFDLEHCDSKGLNIKFLPPDRLIHKCIDGKILTKNKGFYIQFILNYQELSQKENTLKTADIKNYDFTDSKEIWITPFSNTPSFKYEVFDATEEFELNLENNSDDSAGQTGLYLVFQTVDRQTRYNYPDPDNIGIIFDDFVMI